MADEEYQPLHSFNVDNGELDGLTPAKCFTLGVEWQMVRMEADQEEGFSRPIHSANRKRLERLLEEEGRVFKITYMQDDISEGWLWLDVMSK